MVGHKAIELQAQLKCINLVLLPQQELVQSRLGKSIQVALDDVMAVDFHQSVGHLLQLGDVLEGLPVVFLLLVDRYESRPLGNRKGKASVLHVVQRVGERHKNNLIVAQVVLQHWQADCIALT